MKRHQKRRNLVRVLHNYRISVQENQRPVPLISSAVLEAQLPLIVLLLKGFPPFFKPQPRYLMACAEGRLLMLSPYPWQNEKIENMRQRCLHLNDIAAEICKS